MTLRMYLNKTLGRLKHRELMAMGKNQIVIVRGKQQTGKTTLVNVLNAAGYHAVEEFDVCEITLTEPLTDMIPDFAETICVEQESISHTERR